MAAVVPQQVVHPRPRLAVHVQVGRGGRNRSRRPCDADGTCRRWMRRLDLAMRAREAARVRHHADLARPSSPRPASARSRRRFRPSESRPARACPSTARAPSGRRADRSGVVRITASTPGRSMHASRFVEVKRNLPFVGERLPALRRAAGDRHDLDAVDLLQRLHVNDAHGARSRQTNLHLERHSTYRAIVNGSDLRRDLTPIPLVTPRPAASDSSPPSCGPRRPRSRRRAAAARTWRTLRRPAD